MRFQKKWTVLAVTVLMAACGGSSNSDPSETNPPPITTEPTAPQPTPAEIADQAIDAEVAFIMARMSLSEKIDYLRQIGKNWVHPNPTLGIPAAWGLDSPNGIRIDQDLVGTQYPSQKILAATWNIERAKEYGLAIGYETRQAGGHITLAPTLNMYRTPYNGRSSQAICGEDPFLCAALAPAVVNGIQMQGMMASATHFVANEQEADRKNVNIVVDERTLREGYFPPFESVVKNADVANIMCAFTHVNGDIACESKWLLKDVLKGEWKFKGSVASDFDSIRDARKALLAGADLDMGSGKTMLPETIQRLLQSKEISEQDIDEAVRRNLRGVVRFKTASHVAGTIDHSHGKAAALAIAREGIVLLKNEANMLPLQKNARIAVIGKPANGRPATTFGAAYGAPASYITEVQGLKEAASSASNIDYFPANNLSPRDSVWYHRDAQGALVRGVQAQYFSGASFSGTPTAQRVEPGLDINFLAGMNITNHGVTNFSGINIAENQLAARFTAVVKAEVTGEHVLKFRGDGPYQVKVNGLRVVNNTFPVSLDGLTNIHPSSVALDFVAGQTYDVEIEFKRSSKPWTFEPIGGIQGFQASWAPLVPTADLRGYDAVLVSVERSYEQEGESMDTEFALPDQQSVLLQNVMKANANTIVVVHTGGGVDMLPWADKAKAILFAGHTGEIQGKAIAEILYGDVNPSGRLPFSFDRNISDNPSYASYSKVSDYVGANSKKELIYSEGIDYGYRGYLKSGIKPLFPFGFGLSYTTFSLAGIALDDAEELRNGRDSSVQVKVGNTGKVAGYAVPQLYVTRPDGSVRTLKGFAKVWLNPGETKTVSIGLNIRSVASFDTAAKTWTVEPGSYKVQVGQDAQTMVLSTDLRIDTRLTQSAAASNPLPDRVKSLTMVSSDRRF